MPDVLKIAIERREALLTEIASLDRFIETAHALLASVEQQPVAHEPPKRPSAVPAPEATRAVETPQPQPAPQPKSASTGTSQTEAFLRSLKVGRPKKVNPAQGGSSRSKANLG